MPEDYRIGCRAKVERANEHIDALKASSDVFFRTEPKPYRIDTEVTEEGRAYVWKGFELSSIPPIIPILAGEAIHQLRSSLDHLVVAMVRERGNAITKDHGFPITNNPEAFTNARKRGQLDSISRIAQDRIESLQPYKTENLSSSVLWTLHTADIEDKHRLLVVVTASAMMESISITSPSAGATTIREMTTITYPPRLTRMSKDGVELMHVKTGEVNPSFDPDAKFNPILAFKDFGTIELNPAITALTQALRLVVETINQFAGEFAVGPNVAALATVGAASHLRPAKQAEQ
jgi:hypothetical protein